MSIKMLTILTILLTTILSLYAKQISTHLHNPSLTFTVDLNGRGNFTNIQSAVHAVPDSSHSKTLIIMNPGVYREKVEINKTKINILIQGAGYQTTSIVWNDTAKSSGGTDRSYTFAVYADNFIAYDISFKNEAAEPGPGIDGAQAVALRIDGDQAAFYRCGVYSWQDTLLDNQGRHFFHNCFIQGSVDFIYGGGRSLYQDCSIRSIAKESTSGISGYITAQARTSEDEQSGFSFVKCNIDGTGKVLLGRAWRPYATVVFSNCFMSGIIQPDGWSDFGDLTRDKTVTFGEYNCYGKGADYRKRVSYEKQLTESEASTFMGISYIDGEEWLNQTTIIAELNSGEHDYDLISSY